MGAGKCSIGGIGMNEVEMIERDAYGKRHHTATA